MGIYREEVELLLWTLADVDVNVRRVLTVIGGDDDEEEEEEEEDLPDG